MNDNQSRFSNPALRRIFDLNELPEVTLKITVDDWNDLLSAFDRDPEQNFWIKGNFRFTGSQQIADLVINDVGLRVRGNSSRQRPEGNEGEPHNPTNPIWRQASFALQFSRYVPGQTFHGLSRLNLKFIREDPMRIREVYSFDLLQQAGILSGPLMSMCRFFIQIGNLRPAYFGIYKLKEFIDEDYLENRKAFFDDNGRTTPFLWKGDLGAALNDYDPAVIRDPEIYDLRTNTGMREQAYKQLALFVHNLVTLQGQALRNWAIATIDVRLLMRTYMVNVLCGNMDDYWFNKNNFNFYFNTHGCFFFIPNDFDTTLGTGWGIDAGKQDIMNWGHPAHPLIKKLIGIQEFQQMYINAFHEITNERNGPFHVSRSIPRIQGWHKMIQKYIPDDTIHFGCHNDGAGCILGTQGSKTQTPFQDRTAWWSSGGNNINYRILEKGMNNFFEVSSSDHRVPQIHD